MGRARRALHLLSLKITNFVLTSALAKDRQKTERDGEDILESVGLKSKLVPRKSADKTSMPDRANPFCHTYYKLFRWCMHVK